MEIGPTFINFWFFKGSRSRFTDVIMLICFQKVSDCSLAHNRFNIPTLLTYESDISNQLIRTLVSFCALISTVVTKISYQIDDANFQKVSRNQLVIQHKN